MNNNYVPLYRKYRPQNLEQVVGQEHIKKALSNAIECNRISHAYLFTGPRGTGKTSTARIFAKSLNCINGPTVKPCNECENCQNITKSIPIDVIEMDAASNRSVSDAEEIIQNVAMAPVHSRYKIYIIDEVHMLTSTAFNALLKTLEEPPENVIFILATTEVHKVLDTIKSRCQRFDFKRITTEDIAKHLRYISDQENINITDDALNYIATNSAGGMRDSIALLDQLSILNSEATAINVEDINRLLGRLSFNSLNKLFKTISSSNASEALNVLTEIYNQGNEPSQILSNFLEYLRNSLIIKSVSEKDINSVVQLNKEQIDVITGDVANIETHQIVSLIDKCSSYIKELKLTANPKLWLDVAILDMANLTENTKLENLQQRLSMLENGSGVKISSQYSTPPMPDRKIEIPKDTVKSVNSVNIKPQVSVQNVGVQPKVEKTAGNSSFQTLWTTFLDNISSFPSKAILKQQAIPVKIAEDEIIITIKNPTWLKSFSADGERFAFLLESAKRLFGESAKVIVRAPQAGDDKIKQTQNITGENTKEAKPPLVPSPQPKEEEVVEAVDLKKKIDDVGNAKEVSNEEITEEVKNHSVKQNTLSRADSAYHSDNVNMVMDLFEGKIIE